MKHIVGDLLANVNRGIIVHGCNAQGVMGGGFALQVRKIYPEAFNAYVTDLKRIQMFGATGLGKAPFVRVKEDLYIVNGITQDQFGTDKRYVDYEAVAKVFTRVRELSETLQAKPLPIHYPMIGAGLAGGNWTIISTIIDETLIGCDHTLWTLK